MASWFPRLASALVVFSLSVTPALAAVPRGFTQVGSFPGVSLYKQRRDYVQVLNRRQGARLRILHGTPHEEGLFVNFDRKTVGDWWAHWSETHPQAVSVANGQFFDTTDPDTAPLAFSIKADGKVYEGYGDLTEFRGGKRMLIIGATRDRVVPYDDDAVSLVKLRESDAIVGLSPDADKRPTAPRPRTFLGVTRDGRTVVFSSTVATQMYANRVLRSFGVPADQVLMLDGGASTHLLYDSRVLVPADKLGETFAAREKLPQMLGIEAGPGE